MHSLYCHALRVEEFLDIALLSLCIYKTDNFEQIIWCLHSTSILGASDEMYLLTYCISLTMAGLVLPRHGSGRRCSPSLLTPASSRLSSAAKGVLSGEGLASKYRAATICFAILFVGASEVSTCSPNSSVQENLRSTSS